MCDDKITNKILTIENIYKIYIYNIDEKRNRWMLQYM